MSNEIGIPDILIVFSRQLHMNRRKSFLKTSDPPSPLPSQIKGSGANLGLPLP